MFPGSVKTGARDQDNSEREKEPESAASQFGTIVVAILFLIIWVVSAYYGEENSRATVPVAVVTWVSFFLVMPAIWLIWAVAVDCFDDKNLDALRAVWRVLFGLLFAILAAYAGAFHFADDKAIDGLTNVVASFVVLGLSLPALAFLHSGNGIAFVILAITVFVILAVLYSPWF